MIHAGGETFNHERFSLGVDLALLPRAIQQRKLDPGPLPPWPPSDHWRATAPAPPVYTTRCQGNPIAPIEPICLPAMSSLRKSRAGIRTSL